MCVCICKQVCIVKDNYIYIYIQLYTHIGWVYGDTVQHNPMVVTIEIVETPCACSVAHAALRRRNA